MILNAMRVDVCSYLNWMCETELEDSLLSCERHIFSKCNKVVSSQILFRSEPNIRHALRIEISEAETQLTHCPSIFTPTNECLDKSTANDGNSVTLVSSTIHRISRTVTLLFSLFTEKHERGHSK